MAKIKVFARQIFDSRGNPTVEVDVITENGIRGKQLYLLVRPLENMRQ